jgi:hypothetical protein
MDMKRIPWPAILLWSLTVIVLIGLYLFISKL